MDADLMRIHEEHMELLAEVKVTIADRIKETLSARYKSTVLNVEILSVDTVQDIDAPVSTLATAAVTMRNNATDMVTISPRVYYLGRDDKKSSYKILSDIVIEY